MFLNISYWLFHPYQDRESKAFHPFIQKITTELQANVSSLLPEMK